MKWVKGLKAEGWVMRVDVSGGPSSVAMQRQGRCSMYMDNSPCLGILLLLWCVGCYSSLTRSLFLSSGCSSWEVAAPAGPLDEGS